LIGKGIDVILDQWDLGLGDDVPKFMENALKEADRVLMICTDLYVQKADEGEGGVGYEAMIVTGELIRNLGTSKFIPVCIQENRQRVLPKALSTRFYVDFSKDQNFEEQFETLLCELHQQRSATKPPLGKNLFARRPSGEEVPADIKVAGIPVFNGDWSDVSAVYETALNIARQGDLVAWRRIVRRATSPISELLRNWRVNYERKMPSSIEGLHEMALDGADIYSNIFSIALAGVESGRDRFVNQTALIDEILNPKDWNYSGYTVLVHFPDAIACIYQALLGSMSLLTCQVTLSSKLARKKILSNEKAMPLYQRHEIVGWPESLGRKSTDVWKFLVELANKWEWLRKPYGSADEFRESLCAYYIVLNIIEFVDALAEGKDQMLISKEREIALDIPLCFLFESDAVLRRAYALVINDPSQIKYIWQSRDVPETKAKELWPSWAYHVKHWLSKSSNFFYRSTLIHQNLFDDIA
jgi:hypothetical protein